MDDDAGHAATNIGGTDSRPLRYGGICGQGIADLLSPNEIGEGVKAGAGVIFHSVLKGALALKPAWGPLG
jgi:hypothetical protein